MDLNISNSAPEALVHADPAAVEQILFNLVDNACKYAGDADPRRIGLSATTEGKRVLIRVRDHGPGFRSGARRHFHGFSVSAEEAAQRSRPGVGLGLELSRQLARAMGGTLRVERESGAGQDGCGACVTLVLRRTGTG